MGIMGPSLIGSDQAWDYIGFMYDKLKDDLVDAMNNDDFLIAGTTVYLLSALDDHHCTLIPRQLWQDARTYLLENAERWGENKAGRIEEIEKVFARPITTWEDVEE